jgi:hypothetical protein
VPPEFTQAQASPSQGQEMRQVSKKEWEMWKEANRIGQIQFNHKHMIAIFVKCIFSK